ncbi:MAG: hypothetical protein K940chlam7_01922 [Chlamydiae bacterium]|nr:hypothetical protein [Chlamydiota bacterium]
MSHALSAAASYLASIWKSEPSKTVHTFSKENDPFQMVSSKILEVRSSEFMFLSVKSYYSHSIKVIDF